MTHDTNYVFPFEAERRAKRLLGGNFDGIIVAAWVCGVYVVAVTTWEGGAPTVHSWKEGQSHLTAGCKSLEQAMSIYMSEIVRLTEYVQKLEAWESAREDQ